TSLNQIGKKLRLGATFSANTISIYRIINHIERAQMIDDHCNWIRRTISKLNRCSKNQWWTIIEKFRLIIIGIDVGICLAFLSHINGVDARGFYQETNIY